MSPFAPASLNLDSAPHASLGSVIEHASSLPAISFAVGVLALAKATVRVDNTALGQSTSPGVASSAR